MTAFDQLLSRLNPAEADVVREIDRRFAITQALMHKVLPDLEVEQKDYAELLLKFFDHVDDFLDAMDDDDDDDDDDD